MRQYAILAVASALVLTGCNSQGSDNKAAANQPTPVPSFAGTTDSPEAAGTTVEAGNPALYPGAQAGSSADRFVTSDPIDKVIAWYKDPARRNDNMFVSSEKLDDGYLVLGTAGPELKSTALKLRARDGGGTELRVIPYDPAVGLDKDLLKG